MNKRTPILYVVVALIALVLCVVYYIYDPSASAFFPKCPFRLLTGQPCAGCGSQRAIHALLHCNFKQAVEYNFLVVIILPVLAVLGVSSLLRTRCPRFYYYAQHRYVSYTLLVVILLWWVLRIVFHWYV